MNNTLNTPLPGTVFLDPTIADLLAAASAAAYVDFANTGNPGYTPPALEFGSSQFNFLQRFTGFDDVIWGSGKEERYALLYQSAAQANTYLVAFRGTSSVDDMLLDLESSEHLTFVPYNNATGFPQDVSVGDGFNKIYTTKNYSMAASLQAQIFEALQKLTNPVNQILITGHSLGGALASLFSLDVAVSLPGLNISSVTYASPRVGTANWETAYNQTYALQNKTVRVRNSYDLVPKVPPENWPFDFRDIGQEFPVSFSVAKDHIDVSEVILSWHALTNYTYVISKAVQASPQIWVGQFPDQIHDGWTMTSYNPTSQGSPLELARSRKDVENILGEQALDQTISS